MIFSIKQRVSSKLPNTSSFIADVSRINYLIVKARLNFLDQLRQRDKLILETSAV